jgi:hypothetical protein
MIAHCPHPGVPGQPSVSRERPLRGVLLSEVFVLLRRTDPIPVRNQVFVDHLSDHSGLILWLANALLYVMPLGSNARHKQYAASEAHSSW